MRMSNREKPKLIQGICSRCYDNTLVATFFFNPRVATGRYALCESCVDEVKEEFNQEKEPCGAHSTE